MTRSGTPRTLETVERSFRIVETIQEFGGARVSELATHMDMAPSTVHGYLSTLEQNRYLIKEGDEYKIGLKFLHVGGSRLVNDSLYEVAKKKTEELANESKERAQFIVEEHGVGIYVHTAVEESAVQVDARIGKETYLHASAAGKAILSHLPEERVDEVVDRWGLPKLNDNTITDRESLGEELERIRREKVSFNDCESIQGLRAVGVAILSPADEVVGALSISGPRNRIEGEWYNHDLPKLLRGAANEIELKIAYQS